KIKRVINTKQALPIKKPVESSLLNIFHKSFISIVPSANPLTETDNDWVPTFPPESINIGIQAANTTTDSNVYSNCPITPLVSIPTKNKKKIQGARFFAA